MSAVTFTAVGCGVPSVAVGASIAGGASTGVVDESSPPQAARPRAAATENQSCFDIRDPFDYGDHSSDALTATPGWYSWTVMSPCLTTTAWLSRF